MTADVLEQLLGRSPALEAVRRQVRALLGHGSPRLPSLLIEGETGTGKGLLARALHEASPRGKAAFVDVNCAAIPESLLEAELFGYAAGAFSSARRAKPGLVTLAHGGTLFLDELAALTPALQAKLLTAVEEQRVRPLGSTQALAVDVWVLSATSEGLETAVREGRFRPDLYHRLARLVLRLPPLRERDADVVLLARHFLARAAREYGVAVKTLAPDAGTALQAYGWPGNVRELANLMERLTLLGDGPTITAAALELPTPSAAPRRTTEAGATQETIASRHPERASAASRQRTRPVEHAAAPPVDTVWRPRRVTVLRIETTTGAPDSPALMAHVRAVARDKVEAFGGTLHNCDEPGLLAFFGLKPSEDAPIRAAYAAMAVVTALRRALGEVPPVVAAVDVFEGRIGERGRRSVLHPRDADAVIERLRPLLSLAQPGDVAASAEALPHLERAFDDAPLEGTSGPVRLLRVVPAFAGTTRRRLSPFVGRGREVRWLARQVEGLEPGQGRAIGLIGEPGAGKSRLLHEVRESVAPLDVPWLEGRCVDYGSATPYLPLVELLRRMLDGAEHSETAPSLAELLQQAGLKLEQDAPYLERLLGLPGGDRLAGLSPEAIRGRTFEVLRRILQPSGGPVVVAIEDVHWVDRTSEAFLGALVDAMPATPLLLIVTYRVGFCPRWIDRSGSSQLAVRPLDAAASRTIVSSILRKRRADDGSTERLVQQAEGNPFFLEELAWSVAPTKAPGAGVPRTIRDAISARIDRLPSGSQRLLETASVLGREAPRRLLEALVDDRTAFVRDLDLLIAREFVDEHHYSHGTVYAFKHALTQEVAYGRLAPPDRLRLHAAAGHEIERIHAEALDLVLPELARHAVHAQSWGRAYTYLCSAAVHAMGASAFLEAVHLLQQALDALRRLPPTNHRTRQECHTLLELWTAYYESGQYALTPDVERQIEPLVRALGQDSELAALLVRTAQRFWGLAEPQRVVATVQDVLRLAAPTDVRTRSYAHFLAGSARRDSGELPDALEHLQAGARLIEDVDFHHPEASMILPILVNINAWRSEIYSLLGRHHDACAVAEQAVVLARSLGNDSALVFGNAFLGYALLLRGELTQALPILEQAILSSPPDQFTNAATFAASFLAYALALDGQHARALDLLDTHCRLPVSGLGPLQRTRYRTVTTAAYLAAGHPDNARRELDFVIPIARRVDARGHLPTLLRLRAETLLNFSLADLDEVQSLCQEAWKMAVAVGLQPEVARCRGVLGLAQVRAGKTESGRGHLDAASALLQDLGMEYWLRRLAMEADHARFH